MLRSLILLRNKIIEISKNEWTDIEDIDHAVNDKVASGKSVGAMIVSTLAGNPTLKIATGEEPHDAWIDSLGNSLQPA